MEKSFKICYTGIRYSPNCTGFNLFLRKQLKGIKVLVMKNEERLYAELQKEQIEKFELLKDSRKEREPFGAGEHYDLHARRN